MATKFESLKFWVRSPRPLWARIPSSDEEGRDVKIPNQGFARRSISDHIYDHWPWILSTFIFACISGFMYTDPLLNNQQGCAASCRLQKTDLEPASKYLQEQEVRFDGGLVYNETGNLVIESIPGGNKWVGNPTPEMDALWDRVESGSIVLLEGSESDMVRDKTLLFDGYWLTGLDVIHQVHCLNKVRKALYPQYYKPNQSKSTEMLHVEHCLDYVRQAIMCNSDLTPVPLTWYESAQTFGPDFRTTHTCRDFEGLLQWSLMRTSKSLKEKGSGMEHTDIDSLKMPGSLQTADGLSHGNHHGH